jgi:hypothetical protein
MNRFSDSFFRDVEFLANDPTTSAQGATITSYDDPGETIQASVQPYRMERIEPSGVVTSRSAAWFYFQDDPGTLNSNLGVRCDDLFRADGRLYQAIASHYPAAWHAGTIRLWCVQCVAVE